MTKPAILVNVNRCVGCWTCAMACKVGHNLDKDEWRVRVETMGGGNGPDDPAGTWPNLSMKWKPAYPKSCTMCAERTVEGEQPLCVFNCPAGALTYGDIEDENSPINVRIADLKEKGFGISQKPVWENTRDQVYYAERLTQL